MQDAPDIVQGKSRVRPGRHRLQSLLPDVHQLPALLLHRRLRHLGRRGGHHADALPLLGRRERPPDGHHLRPDQHPLGQVPPLPRLDLDPHRRGRRGDVLHARPERQGQDRLRLHHLHADDDGLHRHQHPLLGADGRALARTPRNAPACRPTASCWRSSARSWCRGSRCRWSGSSAAATRRRASRSPWPSTASWRRSSST